MQSVPNKDWVFTRKFIEESSPSRADGLPLRKENSQRRLALAFTQDVGASLKMNQYTIATAFVYWQRFFMRQSLLKQDPYLVASACLLLAGKVEENFKSLQKITETSCFVKNKKDPKSMDSLKANPKLLAAEMDKVVKAEELLLWTLNFDFFVSHPYKPLCTIVKELGRSNKLSEEDRNFFQVAWNFANDSFRTTLCLQPVKAVDVAVACIGLSASVLNVSLPKTNSGGPWWTAHDVDSETLQDIEGQIMRLYKKKDGDSSKTPTSCFSLPATPSLTNQPPKKQRVMTPSPPSAEETQGDVCDKQPGPVTDGLSASAAGKCVSGEEGCGVEKAPELQKEASLEIVLEQPRAEASEGGQDEAAGKKYQEKLGEETSKNIAKDGGLTAAEDVHRDGSVSDGLGLTSELMQELEDVQPSTNHTRKRMLESAA